MATIGTVSVLTALPAAAYRGADIVATLAVSLLLPDVGQRVARHNARDSAHLTAYQALLSREASRVARDEGSGAVLRPGAA